MEYRNCEFSCILDSGRTQLCNKTKGRFHKWAATASFAGDYPTIVDVGVVECCEGDNKGQVFLVPPSAIKFCD